jgi:hypothetical protein
MDKLKRTLIHAVTEYDSRRVNRKDYNHYALAQYMIRVDECLEEYEFSGADLGTVLKANFNDRLLDTLLKAVGLPID